MDVNQALTLLAGLTPAQFMRRHWQKKTLLVRQAIATTQPVIGRAELFKLAARDDVTSRLVLQNQAGWQLKHGPFRARSLPALHQPGWTLLVQGVDAHVRQAHELLQSFRFVPDARLDDLMVSFATPGGGVGPHFDSYDVFLLQVSGRRRWKISQQQDLSLQPGKPLKILQNFQPQQEFVLEPGDMLYLPPCCAHEGVAEIAGKLGDKKSDCMTYSIGFRAPQAQELAAELLHRLADFAQDSPKPPQYYSDRGQAATCTPAAMPPGLERFAVQAVHQALKNPLALACALGEYLSEPATSIGFSLAQTRLNVSAVRRLLLAPSTRMMYDAKHIFINGESHLASGADARLMQPLANQRCLTASQLAKASPSVREVLAQWYAAGWLFAE